MLLADCLLTWAKPYPIMRSLFAILSALLLTTTAAGQAARPIPYPVIPNPQYDLAVEAGTRTLSGEPGPSYWTNRADYDIRATLSPDTRMLRGSETITYHNNSPDALPSVVVHLRQNLHAPGVVRNRPQKLTGGVHIATVRFEGVDLVERRSLRDPGFSIEGTRMTIALPHPIDPGAAATFEFEWSFEVPEAGAPRIGTDDEIFFVGYWYPQIAVYDDVEGWVADAYMGNGEFYMDHGDYTVSITIPQDFLVGATGELQNPTDVLTPRTISRLKQVETDPAVVSIVSEAERGAGSATHTSPEGTLTWKFAAQNVRDFAFGTSDLYVWDATRAETGDGSPAMIHSFYRPDREAWKRAAEFGKFSIEFLSEKIMPYPWPHMSVVEGVIGGGMEFPMITHIGGSRSAGSLFGTTFHEIGHMWFPMIVGHNEKRFSWMDEGLTSFNTSEATAEFWGVDAWAPGSQGYYRIAGTGDEVEPMRHGDQYPLDTSARGIASYNKPAVALNALRGIVGNEKFYEAYREYARRWAYKHPQPYDLFNTFNDVLGDDLDWFWTTMFFETWTLDQAVGSVDASPDGVKVRVVDHGLSPFPAPVRVTYADGTERTQWVDIDVWLKGARETTLAFPAGAIQQVEIDPDAFLPDVDRSNNVWRN